LGVLGIGMGLLRGFLLQWLLPTHLGDLLPPNVDLSISLRAVIEGLLLGLVSAILGLGMAEVSSWLITTQLFELVYRPFYAASALMIVITMLLMTGVGMAASISILRARPITFLREQAEEE
jgi:predicted lysophospholipase L1 biosynthesis ABC-type transport system permease subunit